MQKLHFLEPTIHTGDIRRCMIEYDMKSQVKERIVENNGKIIAENEKLLKAEFPYREMEKAVKVFFELTKNLDQDAVLYGGYRLTVYYR
jgi:hypothetical protein